MTIYFTADASSAIDCSWLCPGSCEVGCEVGLPEHNIEDIETGIVYHTVAFITPFLKSSSFLELEAVYSSNAPGFTVGVYEGNDIIPYTVNTQSPVIGAVYVVNNATGDILIVHKTDDFGGPRVDNDMTKCIFVTSVAHFMEMQ